jgi:hypothetical protein
VKPPKPDRPDTPDKPEPAVTKPQPKCDPFSGRTKCN